MKLDTSAIESNSALGARLFDDQFSPDRIDSSGLFEVSLDWALLDIQVRRKVGELPTSKGQNDLNSR